MPQRPNAALATTKSTPFANEVERLAFYFFAGIAVPTVIWATIRGISISGTAIRLTLIELVIGNVACWYILERLRRYARARLLSYVWPVNLAVFGAILAANNLAKVSFALSLFIACFTATLAISYLVTIKARHASPSLRHLLVPIGLAARLKGTPSFEEIDSPNEFELLIDGGGITGSVIADLHHDHDAEWERLFAKAALQGIPVYHYRQIEESLSGEVQITHLRENDLGSLIPNLAYMSAKRTFDILASMALAPAILLIGTLVAAAIKLDSSGPVLFLQERIGFRGQTFKMVKFRTMRHTVQSGHHDKAREQSMTLDADDRITKIGKFLRKTRLDEIPQVWNILVGDMSWIGPRPEAQDLAEWYEREIPFYSYRHIVRPGMTGWAQVNQGHVTSIEDVEAKLRFDFYYVKNLSLWLDVLIALKTLRVVLLGNGAK